MKKEQISAQLFSFRAFIKTPAELENTLKKLRSYGYSSVQLTTAVPRELSTDDLRSIIINSGMTAISSHERSDAFFDTPDEVIEKLKKLNITHTAYPWMHIMPDNYDEAVCFARKLNTIAAKFKSSGITLSYHNHAREFLKFNNKTMLKIIYDNAPDIDFELDTFWVHKGGNSPVDWLNRTAGKTEYLHIKDYGMIYDKQSDTDTPAMMPVGCGNLNWKDIFSAAGNAGVKYYIVEHDADVKDPFDSFKKSFDYIAENFAE